MNKLAWTVIFIASSTLGWAETWTGNLVDAVCKVSHEGEASTLTGCPATQSTHLFAIELSNSKLLSLDAAGNEKAANAVKNVKKTNLRAVVTGSREGLIVRVDTLEVE